MDKYEFMSELKDLLEKFDNEQILKNKLEIKNTMVKMLELECEYAQEGIR